MGKGAGNLTNLGGNSTRLHHILRPVGKFWVSRLLEMGFQSFFYLFCSALSYELWVNAIWESEKFNYWEGQKPFRPCFIKYWGRGGDGALDMTDMGVVFPCTICFGGNYHTHTLEFLAVAVYYELLEPDAVKGKCILHSKEGAWSVFRSLSFRYAQYWEYVPSKLPESDPEQNFCMS